ncbi:hypothetical protein MPTK1_5g05330 [Marchantia polymorpha subsp. ruderalis]|uniref:Uncharacterized protein n=2 Tax=Marchantia polymorpha TaxID=3197 RepID=A0A176W7M3_MARPO|nr:hypothetical protein AXG93_115s1630 [Marchantia polymorpha subsp. ruderalis]PTQ42981.1 hypothetical protein MARPO_0027s0093 [Marchantia polymorpha]PTQ42982.1 hypothetical protein MARPO_0027s0093 [Marchantia polymorpha]BBN10652.1 hypothetical protein Mp_5g05330 [Marchantia polymorpha subsp. ruderalis]BBN10653.1 hypothetical protein Mp_5g05330 [Marchantia polymorpha subsp. ruderalis]|eukprot:PTQ42981.1 hypothetical protein MARPO_0027s0093 [Marchantia polymorpha]
MARAVGNWMLNVPSAAAAQSCCGGARAGKDVRIGPRGLGRLLAARGVHNATGFRLHALQQRQRPKARNLSGGSGVVRCAMNDDVASPSAATVYQGIYGPWSVDSADIREVILYRSGLVTSAAAFVTVASTAFLPDGNPVKSAVQAVYDPLYALGAGGLGLSLFLIHIYVTPIKRTLQLLWAVGVLGSVAMAVNFAAPADQGLVQFVVDHPAGIWAVGPLFAALTGLAFKEGLCYGKFEAAALFFVIPGLLLGHLSGAMDDKVKLGLLAAWIGLFTVFAARKFTQPIKDDIGDKSVFIFQALPEAEKERIIQEQNAKQMANRSNDE